MGWYITCKYCGEKEKNYHPNCDCLAERKKLILEKITDAVIFSNYITIQYPSMYLFTTYSKDGEIFTVRIIFDDGGGEYTQWETIKLVSDDDLKMLEADDVAIDSKLFEYKHINFDKLLVGASLGENLPVVEYLLLNRIDARNVDEKFVMKYYSPSNLDNVLRLCNLRNKGVDIASLSGITAEDIGSLDEKFKLIEATILTFSKIPGVNNIIMQYL